MPYILKKTEGGRKPYVAESGSESSYTASLAKARRFATREAAKAEACGNETPVYVES